MTIHTDYVAFFKRLEALLVEDLLDTSDVEQCETMRKQGVDPDQVAQQMRAGVEEAIARAEQKQIDEILRTSDDVLKQQMQAAGVDPDATAAAMRASTMKTLGRIDSTAPAPQILQETPRINRVVELWHTLRRAGWTRIFALEMLVRPAIALTLLAIVFVVQTPFLQSGDADTRSNKPELVRQEAAYLKVRSQPGFSVNALGRQIRMVNGNIVSGPDERGYFFIEFIDQRQQQEGLQRLSKIREIEVRDVKQSALPSHEAKLHISISETATAEQLVQMMQAIHGNIVYGPNEKNDFIIMVPVDSRENAIAYLNKQGVSLIDDGNSQ